MLKITPMAATALEDVREETGAPEEFGVRFFADDSSDPGRARLAFTFVAAPGPDDGVVHGGDIDAYVARKHGESWSTPHPEMTEVLKETYGIEAGDQAIDSVTRTGIEKISQLRRISGNTSWRRRTSMDAQ